MGPTGDYVQQLHDALAWGQRRRHGATGDSRNETESETLILTQSAPQAVVAGASLSVLTLCLAVELSEEQHENLPDFGDPKVRPCTPISPRRPSGAESSFAASVGEFSLSAVQLDACGATQQTCGTCRWAHTSCAAVRRWIVPCSESASAPRAGGEALAVQRLPW